LFDEKKRICHQFSPFKFEGKDIRLSFGLPILRPPNMIPCVDEAIT